MANPFLLHPLAQQNPQKNPQQDPQQQTENPWWTASQWANVAAGRVPQGDVQAAIQQCIAAAEYTQPGAGLMALGFATRASNDDGVLMQLIGLVAEGLFCRQDQTSGQAEEGPRA